MDHDFRVLITGGTGYVGGRLIPLLEQDSVVSVRCTARRPESLTHRVSENTEVVHADVLRPEKPDLFGSEVQRLAQTRIARKTNCFENVLHIHTTNH